METREWIKQELQKLVKGDQDQFIVDATIEYINELNSDNESLQVALEGEIWSPKKWSQPR